MYIPLITIENNTNVIYHEVDKPNTVEVMCTGGLKLIRVTGNQGEVPSPWIVSISAPSDQEKFLCVDESNKIKEIQYISIKGDLRYTQTPYIHTCSHTHMYTHTYIHS